jgi:flagellar transcriptional activator FlhD
MASREIRRYIYDINYSYLLLTQTMISQDKNSAMNHLGIDEAMADTLQNLLPAQIAKLAEVSQLLCLFRFDNPQTIALLAQA